MASSFPVFFLYLINACTDGFQTHITSFFQTTGEAHCNLSKNPSSLNRYVWFFSMWQKSINQEKIPFPSVLESRKKKTVSWQVICQSNTYLKIQGGSAQETKSVLQSLGKHYHESNQYVNLCLIGKPALAV